MSDVRSLMGFSPTPYFSLTSVADSGEVFFVFFYQITRRYGCSSSDAVMSAPKAQCVGTRKRKFDLYLFIL